MIYHSDYYGIDTPDPDKLLANQYATLDDMCRYIGADSLEFLSIDGLYLAVGGEKRNPKARLANAVSENTEMFMVKAKLPGVVST